MGIMPFNQAGDENLTAVSELSIESSADGGGVTARGRTVISSNPERKVASRGILARVSRSFASFMRVAITKSKKVAIDEEKSPRRCYTTLSNELFSLLDTLTILVPSSERSLLSSRGRFHRSIFPQNPIYRYLRFAICLWVTTERIAVSNRRRHSLINTHTKLCLRRHHRYYCHRL